LQNVLQKDIIIIMTTENHEKFVSARRQMVLRDLKGRGIHDDAVLAVMGKIPREQFVPEKYQDQAYSDMPLPIGMGQTISQPYVVALMTQLLRLDKDCDVLELGTGSGYQSAVLSRLVSKIYSVERFNQLSEYAQSCLARVGVNNVEFYIGDGSLGWPEAKLFDRIVITAAIPQIPQSVINQLKTGGLLVAPVGDEVVQRLMICEKKPVGTVERSACDVRFVPLIGKYGFNEQQ
jgi:protein-L-isoaspartate(D-aspartate) O-methyltransferase